ncbi:MAG: CarD family transcriptional regulator, partial [Saezia sp.]
MQLPQLKPSQRFTLPPLPGSSDAAFLASFAQKGELLAIVTATPLDAQRLVDEIPIFAPHLRVSLFPDWETLPYDNFSPHQELISERLATLWKIRQGKVDVVIIPASSVLYRLAPPSFLAGYTFSFKKGQKLNEAKLKSQLTLAAYEHVSQVVMPGEYAIRGSIIDLYPMGASEPYRVDLFDDEIDSIRTFDTETQRSLEMVDEVQLLPGREFPMDDKSRTAFRSRWREKMEGDPSKYRIYKDIGEGLASNGIEYYLPLFFDETATVFDYLGEHAQLAYLGDLEAAFQQFWQHTRDRYRLLQTDHERPLLPPEELFLKNEEFYALAKPYKQLVIKQQTDSATPAEYDWVQALPELTAQHHADNPLKLLMQYTQQSKQRNLVIAETAGRRESLLEMLHTHHIRPVSFDTLAEFEASSEPIGIFIAPLFQGFAWLEKSIALITENEIFSSSKASYKRRRKSRHASSIDNMVRDLAELQVGDPIVHTNYGVGRYLGLKSMDMGTGPTEFLHLEYAEKATLYVPVSQLHLIGRYSGTGSEQAPMHKLGSPQWDKAKRKAAEQVRDTAAELLNLYALRSAKQGHTFRFSPGDYEAFATSFGFEETPDQLQAINAIIQDMTSPLPMDRLVCGDVGFGKTEVALRAAFIAVTGGKQVAILAPTTLLAEQHSQTLMS